MAPCSLAEGIKIFALGGALGSRPHSHIIDHCFRRRLHREDIATIATPQIDLVHIGIRILTMRTYSKGNDF